MFNLKFSKNTKDIQWSFLSLAISSFAHLFLRLVLSRELGPSGLGLYTLVFTIYMFGMQFAGFGIGSALTRYIASFHGNIQKIKEFVTSGILGSLISGSVMGIILYLFSSVISIQFFHNPQMASLLRLTAFCFPFIALQKTVIGALNGLKEMKWYAIVNISQNILVMVISFVLVLLLKLDVRGAVLGFVIPTIFIGVVSLTLARNFFMRPAKLINTALNEITSFGFYVVLANSIGMINTQIDSLMIGHFMDETSVGYYTVAIIFVQGVLLLPQAVQSVTTPSIATYYGKGDFYNIQQLLKKTIFKIFVIVTGISFILAASGKFLIPLLFTEEFLPAYSPMLILLIGHSIYAAYASIGGCLSSVGKVQIVFRIDIICAVLNTLLNFALIPRFGLIGAASATTTSLIFTTLINLYFIKRYSIGEMNRKDIRYSEGI
ncbi:flippase [Methanosarcina mazei]|uniref:Polysaccharide biosynthesis protein n=1 Tax=Methanosarcina mazei TaxID=2209 RepID=A0A0F8HZY0_METMZ|nr:flippase [Methanosarcina mazei]KKG72664.1 polysaccharide biosynthesis protein [Methanosarcina mazei]